MPHPHMYFLEQAVVIIESDLNSTVNNHSDWTVDVLLRKYGVQFFFFVFVFLALFPSFLFETCLCMESILHLEDLCFQRNPAFLPHSQEIEILSSYQGKTVHFFFFLQEKYATLNNRAVDYMKTHNNFSPFHGILTLHKCP